MLVFESAHSNLDDLVRALYLLCKPPHGDHVRSESLFSLKIYPLSTTYRESTVRVLAPFSDKVTHAASMSRILG
jgi:hypothetical protein